MTLCIEPGVTLDISCHPDVCNRLAGDDLVGARFEGTYLALDREHDNIYIQSGVMTIMTTGVDKFRAAIAEVVSAIDEETSEEDA